MSFLTWLRNWKRSSTGARRPARKRATFRPELEALEARDLLSFGSPIAVTNSFFKSSPPVAQAMGDVNGDGKLDLVTITNRGGITGVEAMLGKGNGQFTSPGPNLNSGYDHPTALALADVNGDGKLDIITGNDPGDGRAFSMTASIGVLLGDGTGKFATVQTHDLMMHFGPTFLAVGDFDGNGKLDVAAAGQWDYEVDIAFNYNDIADNYWVSQAYALPFPPISGASATIAAGDFNADGKLDLVATNYSGVAFVLLNSGNGFASPQSYAAAGTAVSVAVGDVNGDGKLDLVTANGSSNSVSVLPGNGDGTFRTAQTYAVGGSATSIALGDFNKDGKLDIAVAGTELDMLLNNGDGTFGAAQKVGPGGNSVAVADFNGDGFLDLAQIDGSGAGIDVLLNKADWQTTGTKGHK